MIFSGNFHVLLTSMSSDMALQEPRPREGFAANVTFAVLVMGPHMHCISRHGNVDFTTDMAFLGLFVI